jgi:hypothetical protein
MKSPRENYIYFNVVDMNMALWDQLRKSARVELCYVFGLNKNIANKSWDEIDEWIRMMIQEYFDEHNCDYMKMRKL